MEPVALSALALVAVVGVVAIVLAIVNRHSRRWRFGVFYERDDDDHPPES